MYPGVTSLWRWWRYSLYFLKGIHGPREPEFTPCPACSLDRVLRSPDCTSSAAKKNVIHGIWNPRACLGWKWVWAKFWYHISQLCFQNVPISTLNRQSLSCLVLNISFWVLINNTDKQSVPSTDNNSKQLGLPLYDPRRNPTVLATQEKKHLKNIKKCKNNYK